MIADGKRGDVPVTAAAYAQALLGSTPTPWGDVPGLGADAVTVNPLLGDDALEPLIDAAREAGAGVFVLVRTSNPGAADVQDLPHGRGRRAVERVARARRRLGDGAAARLADVGAVTGATAPEHLPRAARADAARRASCCPASAPRAGGWRTSRRRSPPGRPAAW